MARPAFRGRLSDYGFNADLTEVAVGIDSDNPNVAFSLRIELIPVLIASLRSIAASAEVARNADNPKADLRAEAALIPDRVSVNRDTVDGTILLTIDIAGSPETFQLQEDVAHSLGTLLREVAEERWQPETRQ